MSVFPVSLPSRLALQTCVVVFVVCNATFLLVVYRCRSHNCATGRSAGEGSERALPGVWDLLPHLEGGDVDAFVPKIELGRREEKVELVIGIPTVDRPRGKGNNSQGSQMTSWTSSFFRLLGQRTICLGR